MPLFGEKKKDPKEQVIDADTIYTYYVTPQVISLVLGTPTIGEGVEALTKIGAKEDGQTNSMYAIIINGL